MNNEQQKLLNSLHSLATVEQIAETLGIASIDSMPEDFWVAQRRTVKTRFYWFCLSSLGMALSTEIEELSTGELTSLNSLAERLLKTEGFNYSLVRDWYHSFGSFVADKAFKLRRERRDLEDRVLRVLFIMDKGAKYLAYRGFTPILVDSTSDAYSFTVHSPTELGKGYLADMASNFEVLKKTFGARAVKILPGREE